MPEINLDEERAAVVRALHEDADRLEEEAATLERLLRIEDANRSRIRARFLRLAAVYLLSGSDAGGAAEGPQDTEM